MFWHWMWNFIDIIFIWWGWGCLIELASVAVLAVYVLTDLCLFGVQVRLIDFSPGEKYMVAYSSHEPSNPRDTQVWIISSFIWKLMGTSSEKVIIFRFDVQESYSDAWKDFNNCLVLMWTRVGGSYFQQYSLLNLNIAESSLDLDTWSWWRLSDFLMCRLALWNGLQRVTLNIFDVRSGKVLREFKGSADDFAAGGTGGVAGVSWPVFRYGYCRLTNNGEGTMGSRCFSFIDFSLYWDIFFFLSYIEWLSSVTSSNKLAFLDTDGQVGVMTNILLVLARMP